VDKVKKNNLQLDRKNDTSTFPKRQKGLIKSASVDRPWIATESKSMKKKKILTRCSSVESNTVLEKDFFHDIQTKASYFPKFSFNRFKLQKRHQILKNEEEKNCLKEEQAEVSANEIQQKETCVTKLKTKKLKTSKNILKKQVTVDDITFDSTDISNFVYPKELGKLKRSYSLPLEDEILEDESMDIDECDMDFVVRRMAICPKLGVPAMTQLKTYLILTRLRQYCFI